ncbi:MAG TPA: maleylpyruvate isomerase family mycothiol-dependent enzyme [Sporichthyaceae bacterium]|jgi:maleylpyruvate isomerase
MNRHEPTITVPWMRAGTNLVVGAVTAMSDEALVAPSALPDWSRAHVVAHLSRNAEALVRLVHWAATGEVTPMYPNLDSRTADIEATAKEPPDVLRRELSATAALLEERIGALDDRGLHATVRSALGREMPAVEIPWMRVREVWLHAVDLGAGTTAAQFPQALLVELLDDVAGVVGAKPDCPPVLLRATDSEDRWTLGPEEERTEVSGTLADLTGWVSGRGDSGLTTATGSLPGLPPWI